MGVYSLLKWLFSMTPKRCLLRQEDSGSLFTCNPQEYSSAKIEICCYNAETDSYYCCPAHKLQNMSYTTRITSSISAAVILLICIILICIFSSKCPVKKAYLNRRSRGAERITVAEETPGV